MKTLAFPGETPKGLSYPLTKGNTKMHTAAVNPESKVNFLTKTESWRGVDGMKC